MSTAARFAAAYVALWAAHDLGDHVVQTDHQAAGKAQDWRCVAGHVGSYTATQAVALGALSAVGARPGWRRALAGLAWSAGTHAFLDRRWPVIGALRHTGSARFSEPSVQTTEDPARPGIHTGALGLHGPYLADQALHHVCVAVAAAIIAGGAS